MTVETVSIVDAGRGQTYTVKLSHEPSVEVTVTVTGQDTTDLEERSERDGHPDLRRPPGTMRTVTVKAREDADAKNDCHPGPHGAGGEYEGVAEELAVTVDDDETVSMVLSKTIADGGRGGRRRPDLYGEAVARAVGGDHGDGVRPGQTDLEITGLGEGNTLTFDATTWDDAQTVTVKAREDADAKNDSVTLVHTAAGGEYEGVAKSDVAVTVDDDETVSVVLSKSSLTVVEGDTAGQTYTVKLSHEPSVERSR